ncbi:MAG: META domain-containing protein [Odoribacteraceae bacterium]|jgi:heat shock protein HslJ|nr:META domain-containing protein [Odoribacteraceae bacterium]
MRQYLFFCLTFTLLFDCKPKTNTPFAGMKWVMERIKDQGIKAKEDMRGVFIVFDDTTRVARGRAGCNTYFAAYTKGDDGALSFSSVDATKTACPEMYVEAIFFKILEDTNNYTLRHDKLYLRKDSETIAVFRPDCRK